jgi:SAM-dependent methyltransferase
MSKLIIKSKLINFYNLIRLSNIFFPKILIDYFKIKNIINGQHISLKIDSASGDSESFEKYFILKELFIQEALIRVQKLHLNNSKSKLSILDLGTGAGYFPFICNYYQNESEAIDISGNKFYDESTNALKLKKYHQKIIFDEKLTTNKKYDLVCAYMICFNGHKSEALWANKEWGAFLINIIENNLNSNGRIFLSFNLENDGKPFSKDLKQFFSFFASEITNNEIMIQNNKNCVSLITENLST